jgi:transcription termination factor NusA
MDKPNESIAEMLQRTLHIEASLANALADGGFTCLEEVAYVPFAELQAATKLNEEATTALRNLSRKYLVADALGDSPNF